jgi:hypothetical protein
MPLSFPESSESPASSLEITSFSLKMKTAYFSRNVDINQTTVLKNHRREKLQCHIFPGLLLFLRISLAYLKMLSAFMSGSFCLLFVDPVTDIQHVDRSQNRLPNVASL